MLKTIKSCVFGALLLVSAGAAWSHDSGHTDRQLRFLYNRAVRYSTAVEFPSLVAGDVNLGRAVFGLAPDDVTIDTSQALFQGNSVVAGPVVSNGTACATCHQGSNNFLLPPSPISQHVAPSDPLLTGRNAEAQGDPRSAALFENFGLLKIRVNRFNVSIPETNPFRQVFGWRKTQTIINMAFNYGLLTDDRARGVVEQARGASFNHTQDSDLRFDDLVNPHLADIGAYMQTEVRPSAVADLLNPASATYASLVADPFLTVHPANDLQRDGEQVFKANCMGCHNMPNVFNNRDHVRGNGPNFPVPTGHTFDIGVSQRNAHHLDFRQYDAATATYSTVVLPLAREDGVTINWPATDDPGAAAITGRYEDLHRFKVPQLRSIAVLGPYFHDNSAATLEDVVDFFNGDDYNRSVDGREHPIHMEGDERAALLAFLRIL